MSVIVHSLTTQQHKTRQDKAGFRDKTGFRNKTGFNKERIVILRQKVIQQNEYKNKKT